VEQNFGSMGMLMAHEITHGFDTKGSRFDQDRQLHEWWTKPSRERFQARAHCIRRLYDQFEVAGENVKGRNTLAENIADFGGLAVAYSAYLSWYNQTLGGEPPLSSKRLFFTAYGQNWCSKARPDHLRHSSITDGLKPESSKISNHADCQCRASTSLLAQRRRAPRRRRRRRSRRRRGEAAANPPKHTPRECSCSTNNYTHMRQGVLSAYVRVRAPRHPCLLCCSLRHAAAWP